MIERTLRIAKMHGLGNNYVYINLFDEHLQENDLSTLAMQLSDVNTGVGSDGMILIGPSLQADFRMRIFNKDGSEGKNCGNGLRCVAKYVYEKQMTDKTSFTIETLGGLVGVTLHIEGRSVKEVTVDMGPPKMMKKDIPMLGEPESVTIDEEIKIDGNIYRITAVSMGNPHVIIRVMDVDEVPIADIGPKIEWNDRFPERTNVEFIAVKNTREIDFRVWERGSGITQACGTGACASVVAGVLNGWLTMDQEITVHLLGGDLKVKWSSVDQHVYMTGPATFIFEGEYRLVQQNE